MSAHPGRKVATPVGRAARATAASFFGPVVERPKPPRYVAQPWSRVPVEFVPTPLPRTQLLGITTDHIAVVLSRITVYPTGLVLQLRMTPRPGDDAAATAASEVDFYGQAGGYGAARLATRFRLGLLYDDGRTATNLAIHADRWATEPPPAHLRLEGGRGGAAGTETAHWAWPVPATGNLTLVTDWTARGLPERRTVLDGDELRSAAATSAAAEIWPGARVPPPTPRSAQDDW